MNKFNFNFSFHPVNNSEAIALHCQGIPYTCGNYTKGPNNSINYSSYIFEDGNGTPSEVSGGASYASESEVQKMLIKKAFELIMKFHADKPSKVAAGHIL